MARISLGAAAEQTRGFMRRESGLVLPVAFATFGLALAIVALVTPEPTAGGRVEPGPWSLALFPIMFLVLIGQLSISYLVLRPGASVRDSLGFAMIRLPTAIAALLLLLVVLVGLGLVLIAATGILAVALGASAEGAAAAGVLAVMLVMLVIGARLLMAWPLIADRRSGAVAALKQAFAISKGNVWKFLALTLAFALVYVVLTGAVQLGLGSVLLILGRVIGAEGGAAFLTAILVALLGAAIQAAWAVLLANVYRQLAPAGDARA